MVKKILMAVFILMLISCAKSKKAGDRVVNNNAPNGEVIDGNVDPYLVGLAGGGESLAERIYSDTVYNFVSDSLSLVAAKQKCLDIGFKLVGSAELSEFVSRKYRPLNHAKSQISEDEVEIRLSAPSDAYYLGDQLTKTGSGFTLCMKKIVPIKGKTDFEKRYGN